MTWLKWISMLFKEILMSPYTNISLSFPIHYCDIPAWKQNPKTTKTQEDRYSEVAGYWRHAVTNGHWIL